MLLQGCDLFGRLDSSDTANVEVHQPMVDTSPKVEQQENGGETVIKEAEDYVKKTPSTNEANVQVVQDTKQLSKQ